MPDFIGCFIGQPVLTDQLNLFIAVLSQAKQEEVIIYMGEFPPVVVGSVGLDGAEQALG